MIAYPDTSFLCAMYQSQGNSLRAAEYFAAMPEALHVSSPVLFEFRNSIRFQSFLYSNDATRGFHRSVAQLALTKLQTNIADGEVIVVAVDWADLVQMAERLSAQYTWDGGYRGFDILHIATALHLGAAEFLTFDAKQKKLAEAEGLIVPL